MAIMFILGILVYLGSLVVSCIMGLTWAIWILGIIGAVSLAFLMFFVGAAWVVTAVFSGR